VTGPLVTVLVPLQFRAPSQAWCHYGQVGCPVSSFGPWLWFRRQQRSCPPATRVVCCSHAGRAHPGGEERGILRGVRKGFGEASLEDEVSGAVWKLRESGGRSLVSAEWAETKGLLTFRGKVYVPDVRDLRRQVVAQHHDSRVAGHPGQWKTLELISRNYWWPRMSRYIGEYTKRCYLCLQMKACRQPPLGELHPLPVPNVCWDTISVDFIVELPEAHGYNAVMNVVDSVSKRAHFIPTNTTITAAGC
jgi:Integrase zinc binding domain